MIELSDLEGATLAEVARHGPTTSYAVAKFFAKSPSEYWSGSAGAVYPVFKRLLARGLLKASEGRDGNRARTQYVLSAAGQRAMKGWLLDAKRASDIGFDPLRTRVIHLDMVSASERRVFMQQLSDHFDAARKQVIWPESPRMQAIHAMVIASRKSWIRALTKLLG